jgi:hypothetical protein
MEQDPNSACTLPASRVVTNRMRTALRYDYTLSEPVTIRCDDKAALSLCKDRKEEKRVKHQHEPPLCS